MDRTKAIQDVAKGFAGLIAKMDRSYKELKDGKKQEKNPIKNQ